MTVSTGFFTIITANAQIFVDQENVGRLTNSVFHQEGGLLRIKVNRTRQRVLLRFDEGIEFLTTSHIGLGLCVKLWFLLHQPHESGSIKPDDIGFDRRAHRCHALATVYQPHFADVRPGGQIRRKHWLAANHPFNHHRSLADNINIIAKFAFGDDRLASTNRLDFVAIKHFVKISRCQPRFEHLEQLALGRNPLNRAFGRRHRGLQLKRSRARDFNADAILACTNSRATPPP